jgi:ribonucleoside-diphosphate reductase alpha chain
MYLLRDSSGKVVERPQHMYMRIALWITNSFEEAIEHYDYLSKQLISCATPTMINSGTMNANMASCILIYNESDSRDGLLNTFNEVARFSSSGAGIGLCMSNIRSKESRIKSSGGRAGGLLKFLKMINENLRFFNQQGKRPGVAGIYIEPWHKDIFDFLDIKKNTGAEELRAKDLFTALWIPDLFMKALKEDGDWYLFCPNEIKKAGLQPLQEVYGDKFQIEYNKAIEMGLGKKVKAMDIAKKIVESQIETGVPYILFKDHVNHKSNHKSYGTIKQSNLCVSADSMVQARINGEEVEVDIQQLDWMFRNGLEIEVLSKNIETGEDEYKLVVDSGMTGVTNEMMEIEDSETGNTIRCTPDHMIYTQSRGYVRADELLPTDELVLSKNLVGNGQ